MPETLPLPTLRACVASSKSLVGAAAAAGLDGGEVLSRSMPSSEKGALLRARGVLPNTRVRLPHNVVLTGEVLKR